MTLASDSAAFRDRRDDPYRSAETFLDRVGAVDAGLNVFASVTPADSLLAAALASKQRWAAGAPLSALDGALVSIKDNIADTGAPSREGSAGRPDTPSAVTAPVLERLREAGLLVVGRTTMPDHGCKGVTDGGLHGTTRNPWDPALTAGGSSGGAAASVAAGLTRIAIGTDGGGSIRIPAAFCGVVGLKPTHERVPTLRASPFGTLSHHGPIAATVAEAAALLTVIGPRPGRSHSEDPGVVRLPARFAVWSDVTVDPDVSGALEAVVRELTDLGLHTASPRIDLSRAAHIFQTLWWSGAARAVRGVTDSSLLDPVLIDQASRGEALPEDAVEVAERNRARLSEYVNGLFDDVDLLVSPVTSCLPFEAGHEVPPGSGLSRWNDWAPWTNPFNLTGHPAISLPVGLSAEGLPTAVQLVAARGRDDQLLAIAALLESRIGVFAPSAVA